MRKKFGLSVLALGVSFAAYYFAPFVMLIVTAILNSFELPVFLVLLLGVSGTLLAPFILCATLMYFIWRKKSGV